MFLLNVFHLILDSKLDFNEHLHSVLCKVNKMITLFQKSKIFDHEALF